MANSPIEPETKLNPPDSQGAWSQRLKADPKLRRAVLVGTILLVGVAVGTMIWPGRNKARAEGTPDAPVVAVAKVTRADLTQSVDFDAEFRPYQQAELHAKVAGFLKDIRVDIGDEVKEGELLATLEVPELQDDIVQAKATLRRSQDAVQRSEAEHAETHLVLKRLVSVDKTTPNLVAQQDIDAARAKDLSAEAALAESHSAVDVAKADLAKLETLNSYTRISAPFDGAITKRNNDPGDLIPGGTTSSQVQPLLVLSDNSRLRLAFPVSVSYVSGIQTGQVVQVSVPALGRKFAARISRYSRKVETATRTMDVEVDVTNTDLTFVPGMYATVSLEIARRDHTLALPVTAVSRKGSPSVYVVNQADQLEERPVKIGLETPTLLEILAGVRENELVFVGSRALVHPGQKVEPKLIPNPAS